MDPHDGRIALQANRNMQLRTGKMGAIQQQWDKQARMSQSTPPISPVLVWEQEEAHPAFPQQLCLVS